MTIKTTVDKEPKNKSGQITCIYSEVGRRLTLLGKRVRMTGISGILWLSQW
jgi:hypothetical protein